MDGSLYQAWQSTSATALREHCRWPMSSRKKQEFVVKRLRIMYGDAPPADPTAVVLVKLSLSRLKVLAERTFAEPGAPNQERPKTPGERRSA